MQTAAVMMMRKHLLSTSLSSCFMSRCASSLLKKNSPAFTEQHQIQQLKTNPALPQLHVAFSGASFSTGCSCQSLQRLHATSPLRIRRNVPYSGSLSLRGLATRGHKKQPVKLEVTQDIPEKCFDQYHEENLVNSGWLMRFANENGYLSWCRNTYLTTAVGAAMFVQSSVPYAKEAAEVILMMGGLCLCTGTFSFIYNLWMCRSRMMMSRTTVMFNMTMAVLHLILWVIGVALYLGYVEEDDEMHPQPHDV